MLDSQLEKAQQRIGEIHALMAEAATDYQKPAALDADLKAVQTTMSELEDAWLEAAE